MVSAPDRVDPVFGHWPGTLCCVLGQETLLSECLSPPRCNHPDISRFMLLKSEISASLMGLLVRMKTLPNLTTTSSRNLCLS